MIYQLFILDRLVGLWLKILNSAIMMGLYYGFLTTFSIGPSYLFLIRARVMDKGTETEIAATTGFITGQLMMFISIYYAPLHLALIRPHTITVLTLPYLFFNFVYKNNKHYYSADSHFYLDLDYGYKNPNSIRKFRIYKVFFNNLFFQLSNPLLFPSSILLRLMNIYLFRSNNKLLFLTSSFLGWLIGHIFLMKCIGLILLVWSKQKNSIKSKLTMRFDKYILLQLRNYVGQIFVVFSFVIVVHYLGRTPVPYLYTYTDEILEYDEKQKDEINGETEIDVEIDSEQEQNGSIEDEEDILSYLFPKKDKTLENIEQDNNLLALEKPLVTTLFDYRKWNRPLRYIKNDHFERVVRDENSQFFFHICQSDGKERISFTYPPDLSSFLKIMEKKMDLFTKDKISYNDNELSNYWSSNNKEKRKKLSNEFFKRAKVLDKKYKKYKKFIPVDVFENRIRLSNDKRKIKYLTKIYDPFLNGPFRGQSFSPSIQNETYTTNSILINKIHGLLLINSNYPEFDNSNYPEFEQKIDQFDRKFLLTEIGFFFNLISQFSEKSVSSFNFDGLYLFPEHEQVKIYSEEKKRKKKFLFEAIRTDQNNQTIFNRKKCTGINEISKQVPRWSYELIDELEQMTERLTKEFQIRSAKAERMVIFNGNTDSLTLNIGPRNDNDAIPEVDLNHEFFLVNFLREPDFDRDIIKGSMRPLRRKIATTKLSQGNAQPHSPIFLEMIDPLYFLFGDLFDDLSQIFKEMFRKPGTDNSEFVEFQERLEHKYEEDAKDDAEIRRLKIEEDWESILYGLIIRSFVLLIQSFFRKYILLPSLIITKNIIRILLFQNPEWSEDFRDWSREVHIKCTYQGIPVSDKELPKNWFDEGIQIRILNPFVLKAWHKSKVQSTEKKKKKRSTEKKYTENKNFWFLTGYGTLVESYLDEGFPRDPLSIFGPVLKTIRKQLKKDLKKHFFLVLKFLNERKKWFRTMLKKIENWNIKRILKSILFRFKIIDETIDELSESKKTSTISKNNSKIEVIEVIEESPVKMESINWTNSSFTEKRIKDLNVKTKTIIKQIETMTEEKKEGILTSEINLNSNKTTYDAKRLELQKNNLQILQRRFVRLIRKSYSFFKIFIEGVYIDILLCISSIARIHGQRFLDFLESTDKILNVKKPIYDKKKKMEEMEERFENLSLSRLISILEKSENITNMNSQNSWDVSSLSSLPQEYVFYKLSQIQFSNGSKFKIRSILESPGRSFFLKNEIKDYFFRMQGTYNSKLRHKKRSDSLMNPWTNWFKVLYQYDLPEKRWSRLVSQNWRNRINEHRVAQNKDLVEYDSYEKNQLIWKELILSKKQEQEGDLLKIEIKNKIKKQYRYDLFSYQYLNFANKKKSSIYGYRSPNKNQAISYNYNISIQNYLEEYDILDMEKNLEKNLDRKYFNWMGMNVKRKKTSRPKDKFLIPGFWFFSKLSKLYCAYKMNPWILPIKFFVLQLDNLELTTEEYVNTVDEDLKSVSYYYKGSDSKYRTDLKGERDFLLSKYLGFYLHCDSSDEEIGMDNTNLFCLLLRMKKFNKIVIMSIKKLELDIEMLVDSRTKDFCYTECRDTEDLKERLIFFIEPIRLPRKKHEQSLLYQTIRLPLIHKSKTRKSWSWKKKKSRVDQKITENKDKNLYDLFVPENLLSTRRRRELRILTCFNPRNRNTVHRKTINDNENQIKNVSQVLTKNKDLDSETKKLMNFKLFLWPNYRLEDLACINRYWFNTHNGSHFSILRIHMYPRLKD